MLSLAAQDQPANYSKKNFRNYDMYHCRDLLSDIMA